MFIILYCKRGRSFLVLGAMWFWRDYLAEWECHSSQWVLLPRIPRVLRFHLQFLDLKFQIWDFTRTHIPSVNTRLKYSKSQDRERWIGRFYWVKWASIRLTNLRLTVLSVFVWAFPSLAVILWMGASQIYYGARNSVPAILIMAGKQESPIYNGYFHLRALRASAWLLLNWGIIVHADNCLLQQNPTFVGC